MGSEGSSRLQQLLSCRLALKGGAGRSSRLGSAQAPHWGRPQGWTVTDVCSCGCSARPGRTRTAGGFYPDSTQSSQSNGLFSVHEQRAAEVRQLANAIGGGGGCGCSFWRQAG